MGKGKLECVIRVHARVDCFFEERTFGKISRVNGRAILFFFYDFHWHRCFSGWWWSNMTFLYFSSAVDYTGGHVWAL
jgi:hypothetical protein